MFNHLDPYSRYIAARRRRPDRARRSGEAGVGLTIARDRTGFVVTGVNADGPAAEAGIRVGDRVIAVDGQPTAGKDLDDRARLDRRAGGHRHDDDGPRPRRAHCAPSTSSVPCCRRRPCSPTRMGDMLLVRITGFSADTDQRLARETHPQPARRGGRPIRGLVLDLRGNRGGLLRQAVAAIALVLDHGHGGHHRRARPASGA